MRTRDIAYSGCAQRARRRGLTVRPSLPLFLIAAGLLVAVAAGCGGSQEDPRGDEERLAERTLQAALEGERAAFLELVDPSFVEQLREEMPDADDEVLGGVLIAGFLEKVPFAGIAEASYSVLVYPDGTVVYVSGRFMDEDGSDMVIGEADAVRVPLVREGGRLYVDLLDL